MRATLLVVGDLGRSPRMQYHARALAADGVDVDLVGYEGVPLPIMLTSDPRVRVHRLKEPRTRGRAGRSTILYGLFAVVDACLASARLLATLMRMRRPDLLLVQNPPSFPTLQVAWIVARLRRARF